MFHLQRGADKKFKQNMAVDDMSRAQLHLTHLTIT